MLIIQSMLDSFSLAINLKMKFFMCQLSRWHALGIRYACLYGFNLVSTDSIGGIALFVGCVTLAMAMGLAWYSMVEAYSDFIFFYLCSIENTYAFSVLFFDAFMSFISLNSSLWHFLWSQTCFHVKLKAFKIGIRHLLKL